MTRAGFALIFDERKAAQAAGRLLARHGAPMPEGKLAALLYLLDRRGLIETGCPTTGDRWMASRGGPAPVRMSALINAPAPSPDSVWRDYVSVPVDRAVCWAGRADCDGLSEYDCDLLDELHDQFIAKDEAEICDYMRSLPEWGEPDDGAEEIDPVRIMRAAGLSEQEIEGAVEEAAAHASLLDHLDRFARRHEG